MSFLYTTQYLIVYGSRDARSQEMISTIPLLDIYSFIHRKVAKAKKYGIEGLECIFTEGYVIHLEF